MKIMQVLRTLLVSVVVIALPLGASLKQSEQIIPVVKAELAMDGVRQDLEGATNKAAQQITAATIVKNDAREAADWGKIKQSQAKAIIAEQDAIIAGIKQELAKMVNAAHTTGQYLASFLWSTEQEKNLARAVIVELEELKEAETNPAIIKALENDIYEQQIIAGDVMSTKKKLLIGAMVTAAGVAGLALTNYYLNMPNALSLPPKTLLAEQPKAPIIDNKENTENIETNNQTSSIEEPSSNQEQFIAPIEKKPEVVVPVVPVDPLTNALQLRTEYEQAKNEEHAAVEQKNAVEQVLEDTPEYKKYVQLTDELTYGGATVEEVEDAYNAMAQTPEFSSGYAPAYGEYEAKLNKEKDLEEQFNNAAHDVQSRLQKLSEIALEEQTVEDAALRGEEKARDNLFFSNEYKNYEQFRKKIESGIATEEEKQAAQVAHDAMIQSDVYKKYIAAPDEAKKAKVARDLLWNARKYLQNEPEKLKRILDLRKWYLEPRHKSFFELESKKMQRRNTEFPIDYTVEQLEKILQLDNEHNQWNKKDAESKLWKAQWEYDKRSKEVKNYRKKETDKKLGLATDEDLKNAAKAVEESDAYKTLKSVNENLVNGEAKNKELREQLINELKAPALKRAAEQVKEQSEQQEETK